jgi:DNA polymerase III subunit delta'
VTTLSQILGQTRAVSLLTAAYRSKRLAHGLLFAGPVGVGKATAARALGKLLLCQQPAGIEPCGGCESCRVFDGGNHPDWHVIRKELIRFHDKTGKSKGIDLSIHVIRPELIEPAGRKPALGRGKVFVIEQAELMNAEAQNALLKTLEEPAGTTFIMLLTDQPESLLATVRSRCQLVPFVALSDGLVVRELSARGISGDRAEAAAELAGGSLGMALEFAQHGIVEQASALFPIVDAGGEVHEFLKSAADAHAARQIEIDPLASKDQATRQGLGLYLRLASEHLRGRLAVASAGPKDQREDATERVCRAIDAVVRAESMIDSNVNIPLALQWLSIELREAHA